MNALIIVDLQNDFLPGGALPVPHGDEVIPLANELQQRFALVLATQDWHPPDHGSFAPNHPGKKPGDRIILDGIEQILWPVHCVQDTHGAEFAPSFDTSRIARI
ncbi:MAG: nicotinamidase, partial [Verrucomicrobia bacterium]